MSILFVKQICLVAFWGGKKKVIDLCSEELKISLEIKRLNTEEPDDATKKQVAYLIDQG